MAYVGVRPVDVIDLSKSDALNVTTSATIGGDLNISDKIIHSGDTNTAIRFAAADTVTVETAGSEAFRIDSSQNVGIGTTPASGVRLDIRNNSTTNIADLRNANSAGFGLYVAGGTGSSYYALRAADKDNNALFTVRGDGNVGIGTTSPSGLIHVQTTSGTDADLYLQTGATTDDSVIHFGDNGNASAGKILYDHDDNALTFDRGGEAMRINTSRTIFIGRTSGTPSSSEFGMKLAQSGLLQNSRDAGGTGAVFQCFGNSGQFRAMGDGDAQNTNNSYGSLSDEKLKENISDASSQWDDIKAVRIRKYSLKERKLDAADSLGVIAQELEASGMNGLVKEVEVDIDSEETVKAVKYSILYMKAVKALQEAMARIETLETKVAALEAE